MAHHRSPFLLAEEGAELKRPEVEELRWRMAAELKRLRGRNLEQESSETKEEELERLRDEAAKQLEEQEKQLKSEIRAAFGSSERQGQFERLRSEIGKQAVREGKKILPQVNYRDHLCTECETYLELYQKYKRKILRTQIKTDAGRIAGSLLQELDLSDGDVEKEFQHFIFCMLKDGKEHTPEKIYQDLQLKHRDIVVKINQAEAAKVVHRHGYYVDVNELLESPDGLKEKLQKIIDRRNEREAKRAQCEAELDPYRIQPKDFSALQVEAAQEIKSPDAEAAANDLTEKISSKVRDKLRCFAKILAYEVAATQQQMQEVKTSLDKDTKSETWMLVRRDAVHVQMQLHRAYDIPPSLPIPDSLIYDLAFIAEIASKVCIGGPEFWDLSYPFKEEAEALAAHADHLRSKRCSVAQLALIENIVTRIKDELEPVEKKGKVLELSQACCKLLPQLSAEKNKLKEFQERYQDVQSAAFDTAISILDLSLILGEIQSYARPLRVSFEREIFRTKLKLLGQTHKQKILLDIKILLLKLIDDVLSYQDHELAALIKHKCRFIFQKLENPLIGLYKINALLDDIDKNEAINFLRNYRQQEGRPSLSWRLKAKFHRVFNATGQERSDLQAIFGFPNKNNVYNYVEAMFGGITLLTFLKNILIKVPLDFAPAAAATALSQSESLEGIVFFYLFSGIHFLTKRVAAPWQCAVAEYNQDRGIVGGLRAAVSLAISAIGIALIILLFANIFPGLMPVLAKISNAPVLHSIGAWVATSAHQIGVSAFSNQMLAAASALGIFFTMVLAPLRGMVKSLAKGLCGMQKEIEAGESNIENSIIEVMYKKLRPNMAENRSTELSDTDTSSPGSTQNMAENRPTGLSDTDTSSPGSTQSASTRSSQSFADQSPGFSLVGTGSLDLGAVDEEESCKQRSAMLRFN